MSWLTLILRCARLHHIGAAAFCAVLLSICGAGPASAQLLDVPNATFQPIRQWEVRVEKVLYRPNSHDVEVTATFHHVGSGPGFVVANTFRAVAMSGGTNYGPRQAMMVNGPGSYSSPIRRTVPHGGEIQVVWTFQVGDGFRDHGPVISVYERPAVGPGIPGPVEFGPVRVSLPTSAPLPPPTPTAALHLAFPIVTGTNVRPPVRAVPVEPEALVSYPDVESSMSWRAGWLVRVDSVTYGLGGTVRVNTTLYSYPGEYPAPVTEFKAYLGTNTSSRKHAVITSRATLPNGTPVLQGEMVPVRGYFYLDFFFNVGDEASQRAVEMLTLERPYGGPAGDMSSSRIPSYNPPTRSPSSSVPVPSSPAPTLQPPPEPVPTPGMEVALEAYAGTYRSSMESGLTLAVQNGLLVGQAADGRRETVRLAMTPARRLTGLMSLPNDAGAPTWFTLDLSGDAGADLQGQAAFFHTPSNSPMAYALRRQGGTGTGAAPPAGSESAAGGGASGAFTEAGYFALRVDAARRDGRTLEVNLTARNYQGGRQAVQQTDNRFFLVTSRGEIRWNGNFYGATGADHLEHTVWLEKDEEAQITYVFEGLGSDAIPQRLVVRDYANTQIGSFDLSGVGEVRATAGSGADGSGGAGVPAGQAIILDRYTFTIERIGQGVDGDWETTALIRNPTEQAQRLAVSDLAFVLYGDDGRAWHANGSFFNPDGDRRVNFAGERLLEPGQEVRVRLWHPQSARARPVRFRVQESGGKTESGSLPPGTVGAR